MATSKLTRCLKKDRLTQLKTLAKILAEEIDQRPQARELAQLVKQYRETIREIEDIEGTENKDDEIEEILQRKKSDGTARTVRPDRS